MLVRVLTDLDVDSIPAWSPIPANHPIHRASWISFRAQLLGVVIEHTDSAVRIFAHGFDGWTNQLQCLEEA